MNYGDSTAIDQNERRRRRREDEASVFELSRVCEYNKVLYDAEE